jgi:hypothetical protein
MSRPKKKRHVAAIDHPREQSRGFGSSERRAYLFADEGLNCGADCVISLSQSSHNDLDPIPAAAYTCDRAQREPGRRITS